MIFRTVTAVLEGRAGADGAVTLLDIGVGAFAPTAVSSSAEEVEGTEAAVSANGTGLEGIVSALTILCGCGTTASCSVSP